MGARSSVDQEFDAIARSDVLAIRTQVWTTPVMLIEHVRERAVACRIRTCSWSRRAQGTLMHRYWARPKSGRTKRALDCLGRRDHRSLIAKQMFARAFFPSIGMSNS